MKKYITFILLTLVLPACAQYTKSMFSKDPILNLENWDKSRLTWGYYLGFNAYDFKIDYKENEPEIPLIIHRAPLGTHERFIGFLLEHYAGKFPVWLAPLQVKILPISDKFLEYAEKVQKQLQKAGVRVEIDDRQEKIGKKIRDTELMRVPYMLVVGEKEMNENKLAVRRQGKGDIGVQDISLFLENILDEIENRKSGE